MRRRIVEADALCGRISEVSSTSFDADLTGIGSSPSIGDLGRTGVFVPSASTASQLGRYLIRLCGVYVPEGYWFRLVGLRQLATIRAVVSTSLSASLGPVAASTGCPPLLALEREIESPLWSFVDGNISWHLRWQASRPGAPRVHDPSQQPGTSPSFALLDSSLLYRPPLFPYRPPNNGSPVGRDVGPYGTFRDIRFPWQNNVFTLSEPFRGPGALVFYASVRQTCADSTRPAPTNLPGLRPEDAFWSNFATSAVYGRVAGAILFEVEPCIPKSVQVLERIECAIEKLAASTLAKKE